MKTVNQAMVRGHVQRIVIGAGWRARGFFRSEAGAVSAEFVMILPALLAILCLTAGASLLLAMSSEVQQVSYELTRGGLRYYTPGISSQALCAALQGDLQPAVLNSGHLVEAERFRAVSCDLSADSALSVTVVYDLQGSRLLALGHLVGLNLVQLTGRAKIWM